MSCKHRNVLLTATAAFLLSGCGAPILDTVSEEVIGSFQNVNADMESLLLNQDSVIVRAHRTLAERHCTTIKVHADSLREGRFDLLQMIHSLKENLKGAAPDNYVIADSLLNIDGLGDRLHDGLTMYYAYASMITAGDSLHGAIVHLASSMEDPPGPETWRTRNFFHVPAVAVQAILSKYATDISKAEELCMEKLLRDCMTSAPH